MGCAACGSGNVKRREPRMQARRKQLETSLTAVMQKYDTRDIYFIAGRTMKIFSIVDAISIVRECEQLEIAMGLGRGTHSAAMWSGLLDKPKIASLIEDVKDVKLSDQEIFVITHYEQNGLVTPENIVPMSFTDAVTRTSRAP